MRDYTPTDIGKSPFKGYSALLNFKWTRKHNLETVSAYLRKLIRDIMEGIREKYAKGVNRYEYKISIKLMDLITHMHIYALLPNYPESLRTDYIKFYNPNLEFSKQFKLHTEKLGERLERHQSKIGDTTTESTDTEYNNVNNISSNNQRNKQRYNRNKRSTQSYKNFENLDSNSSGYNTESNYRNNRKYYNTGELCYYCERYSHSSTNCIYKPYCSTCRHNHVRGTMDLCYNTK